MAYSLTWLADALRDAGLKVIEQPGWQTRGHGDAGKTIAVLAHHTAGGKKGNMPSLRVVTYGRPDLSGPLCNLALGRDGTFYIVAAGKTWHAGKGIWKGVRDFNGHAIGIEAENTGYIKGPTAELWPPKQIDAYAKGCAAILDYIKQPVTQCVGHKEFAPSRKIDPTFNMDQFRTAVSFYMKNPKGTWAGTLDRMISRLTIPTHNHDGCCILSSERTGPERLASIGDQLGEGDMAETPPVVTVPVKPPVASTINWVQITGLIVSAAAYFKLSLAPDQVAGVIMGIQGVVALYTLVKHTWFERSVISTSVKET